MLNIKTGKYAALATVVASAFLTQVAGAETLETRKSQVRYAASELETPQTAEAVIKRIHDTADAVCWKEMGPKRHIEKSALQRCLAEVTQDLVDKIDNSNLNVAHKAIPAPKKLETRKALAPSSYVGLSTQ